IKGVKGVDFWSEAKGHGQMVCTKVGTRKVEGLGAHLPTQKECGMPAATKIMKENRAIGLSDFAKPAFMFSGIDLPPAASPISFADTKEGCMGVRVNDVIRADKNGNGTIENADGKKGEKDCRTMHSAWMDYSGQIDGKTVGLAIFDDPKNPHPAFWHVRGYG